MAKLPRGTKKERIALLIVGLLAAANLIYQFWVSIHQTRLIAQAEQHYLVLAVISQTLVYFAFLPAFRAYFSAASIHIPYRSGFRLIISGIGLAKVIPLGEYIVWRRQLKSHPDGVGIVTRFMIVYYSLMFSILIILYLLSEALIFTVLPSHHNQSSSSFTIIPIIFTAVGVIVVALAQIKPVRRAIINFFSRQLGSPLYAPWSILRNLAYTPADLAILVSSITLTLLVEATTLSLSLRAFGLNPSFALVLYGYSFTRIFSLIPILPGGVGEVEAGTVLFFAAYGYPVQTVLTATILFRLLTYWIPVAVGAISYARLGHEHEPVWRGSKMQARLTKFVRT